MLKVSTTKQFEKDLIKSKKQKHDVEKLLTVIEALIKNKLLEKKRRNHKLKGNFIDRWECHIESDWLLIYRKTADEIRLERLGSHSELFK